jgi:hypothetical protein
MEELVKVKSKTINNESVLVIIKNVKSRVDGENDKREITRSITFKDFECLIPFKWAKILTKQNPKEFVMIESLRDQGVNKTIDKVIKSSKERFNGFTCSICGATAKSKSGLSCHMRIAHPEKWEGKKTKKIEVKTE